MEPCMHELCMSCSAASVALNLAAYRLSSHCATTCNACSDTEHSCDPRSSSVQCQVRHHNASGLMSWPLACTVRQEAMQHDAEEGAPAELWFRCALCRSDVLWGGTQPSSVCLCWSCALELPAKTIVREHGRQHLSGDDAHSKQPSLYPASTAAAGLVKVPTARNLSLFSASTAAPAAVAGQMQDLLCGMAEALMTHLTRQQGLLHQAVASQQHQISYSFPRHHHHHISRNQPVRGQSSACSNTLSGSMCQTDTDTVKQMGRQTNRQTGRQGSRGEGR